MGPDELGKLPYAGSGVLGRWVEISDHVRDCERWATHWGERIFRLFSPYLSIWTFLGVFHFPPFLFSFFGIFCTGV